MYRQKRLQALTPADADIIHTRAKHQHALLVSTTTMNSVPYHARRSLEISVHMCNQWHSLTHPQAVTPADARLTRDPREQVPVRSQVVTPASTTWRRYENWKK